MQTPAGRSLPGFAVPINNSSAEHVQSEAEAILNLSLLKFQIAGQNQVQLGGRFCHKAAALVEDGLFQRVAGKTAVAGGAAVQRLTALVVAQKREGTALGKAVALALCQHVGDVQQLVCCVVRELDLVGGSGWQDRCWR